MGRGRNLSSTLVLYLYSLLLVCDLYTLVFSSFLVSDHRNNLVILPGGIKNNTLFLFRLNGFGAKTTIDIELRVVSGFTLFISYSVFEMGPDTYPSVGCSFCINVRCGEKKDDKLNLSSVG